jgi:hypothetical protein
LNLPSLRIRIREVVRMIQAAVAGCGGGGQKRTLKGTLTAPQCGGGYALVNASVEIRDESNKLIGSGSTGSDEEPGPGCGVSFVIENLPKASFYQIQVGTHGAPSYTYDQLQKSDWEISLSLD